MAIDKSIPGVANAFSIMFLIMSIYAILGVELFGNGVVEFECNQAYFDNYSQSMLTLMQVLTGDSWAECIARPCITAYPLASLFFVTYILITTVMLMNIAVAVLLEKFVGANEQIEKEQKEQDTRKEAAERARAASGSVASDNNEGNGEVEMKQPDSVESSQGSFDTRSFDPRDHPEKRNHHRYLEMTDTLNTIVGRLSELESSHRDILSRLPKYSGSGDELIEFTPPAPPLPIDEDAGRL
eukprot:CAMPEP_0182570044 /NCGR_PEP_ID=MMETSP1324-20130603/10483_1 /TAXON_ID=236786 /ORGANISM="Florenciella sp., Strain RCC1587" /LENGTH=240 /DNA_ID=CAMNT_0024784387 /DNA_START=217 /DNA_END=939 /DNA_ORIENTATION=-